MPDLPRSVSVLRLFLSANPWVTANAFWSTASAGSRWVRPFFGRYFSRLATVVSRSGLAAFGDCVPVTSVCMELAYVAAYSGTTAIEPFSNELWKISWLATVFTVTVKPAFWSRSAYIWASRLLSVKPAAPTVSEPEAPPPLLPPPVGVEPPELPPPHAASIVASTRMEENVAKRRERIMLAFCVPRRTSRRACLASQSASGSLGRHHHSRCAESKSRLRLVDGLGKADSASAGVLAQRPGRVDHALEQRETRFHDQREHCDYDCTGQQLSLVLTGETVRHQPPQTARANQGGDRRSG